MLKKCCVRWLMIFGLVFDFSSLYVPPMCSFGKLITVPEASCSWMLISHALQEVWHRTVCGRVLQLSCFLSFIYKLKITSTLRNGNHNTFIKDTFSIAWHDGNASFYHTTMHLKATRNITLYLKIITSNRKLFSPCCFIIVCSCLMDKKWPPATMQYSHYWFF